MKELCKKIVEKLREQNKTISFMESCTGGFLANEITNIQGASDILKVSLVTYSTEYKQKFGVDKEIIKNYTVYSIETAREMAKRVSEFSSSTIGVGITGELGNTINKEPKVYYTIYFADKNKYIDKSISVQDNERANMKLEVTKHVLKDTWEELNELYK